MTRLTKALPQLPPLARFGRRAAARAAAAALAALLLACASPVDEHWGDAHRRAARAQTIDLQAGASASGPSGLDARTAELVGEIYERNQRDEQTDPRQIFLIHQ